MQLRGDAFEPAKSDGQTMASKFVSLRRTADSWPTDTITAFRDILYPRFDFGFELFL